MDLLYSSYVHVCVGGGGEGGGKERERYIKMFTNN